MKEHTPVQLNEVIRELNIKEDGIYVDLTLGRAGHATEILKRIPKGQLVAFDKDKQAIKEGGHNLANISTSNFIAIHSDNRYLKDKLENIGIKLVDGILLDLGVSSPQLDDAERGFSYNKESRLDMRMDRTQELDAHKIINSWKKEDLIKIFKQNANVKLPHKIAEAIIKNRPIDTTIQLVELLRDCLPAKMVRQKNPAKAVFQAIRIAVNNEIDSLNDVLSQGVKLLKKNSSFAIITFHSIEDRVVKKYFGSLIKNNTGKLPIILEKKYIVKTIKPSKNEININKRSRSAKLRVLRKIK